MPVLLDLCLPEAAHIIPLLLNGFEESHSTEPIGLDFSLFKSLNCLVLQHKATITWDIMRSWTGIDLDKLVGSKKNILENAILMCCGSNILILDVLSGILTSMQYIVFSTHYSLLNN